MDNVEGTIDSLLESARIAIETALSLGRTHNVPVDLTKLGITEDMWYVDEAEYREQYIADNYFYEKGDNYQLTEEELAEVEAHMSYLRERNGYDDYGSKVLGWMSSSTNC